MKRSKIKSHTVHLHLREAKSNTKSKRTFSLSSEAVAYLDAISRNYRSVSEALDALIREKQEQAKKEQVVASITSYYDSISEEERAENRQWGEFVHSHLTGE